MTEYIKREDALSKLYHDGEWVCDARSVYDALEAIPKEDVAPVVHGQWKPTEYPFMAECENCSECGYRTVFGSGWNYCPDCGAKMDGGADDGMGHKM